MREIFMSGATRAEGIRTSGFSSATLLYFVVPAVSAFCSSAFPFVPFVFFVAKAVALIWWQAA